MSQGSSAPLGSGIQGRVNFGWLTDSWKLFGANAPLWISAVVISIFAPALFTAAVLLVSGLARHAAGVHASLPKGLTVGLEILEAIYLAFVLGGIGRMAVKQVTQEAITFRDLFSGAQTFGNMLLYMIVSWVLIGLGSLLLGVGGIFVAALLLPAFAMVSDGVPVPDAISRSVKAMLRDRGIATGFMFVLVFVLAISSALLGIGLLVTLPMYWLISALAYRDVVGIARPGESLDAILGIDNHTPWQQAESATAEFGYSQGSPRVSLTGEPIDDQNGTPPSR
jgi:uncharacterized membrane protein